MEPSALSVAILRQRLVDVAAPETRSGVPGDAVAHAVAQAGKRACRLRATITRAGGRYLAERLHRVRIEAKKLRYALEIQRELARSRSRLHLNRLKTPQDLLGRMHDLEILIDNTRAVQASLPALLKLCESVIASAGQSRSTAA
ncbi:MAG: hypothetical protein RJA55_1885 [Acidobacteriota bacterium]|jgi:CHAD domain-containing protein